MSTQSGKLFQCNRCGCEKFVPTRCGPFKEASELFLRFRWEESTPIPISPYSVTLCKRCYDEFKNCVKEFFESGSKTSEKEDLP